MWQEIDSFLASAAPLKASPSHQREYRCTELDYSALDLAEAAAAESVSDFRRENSLAWHAVATATAQGARLLVARARLTACSALDYLHDLKNAMSACEEAKAIYASAGNPQGVATTLLNMGNVFADRGELGRANQVYEESLKISRRLGNQGSTASALNNRIYFQKLQTAYTVRTPLNGRGRSYSGPPQSL
jgi:tetratricopeptide (TPR) repeat protein